MKQTLQAKLARTGDQRRKGQRRRGKLGMRRDLREDRPARPRDHFPRHQSGWRMFFALGVLFFHIVRRRRIPMPASPRHRALQPPPSTSRTLTSCCLVRLSNGGLGPPDVIVSSPACTRRKVGFQWGSLRPQQRTVVRCAQWNIHFRPRTCQFFMRLRELGLRTSHFRVDCKRYHLRTH